MMPSKRKSRGHAHADQAWSRKQLDKFATGNTGFTLIELLVCVSILGILVGLLMPAVQSAREASRRLSCLANLGQLGIALNNYSSSYSSFPYLNMGLTGTGYGSYSPHTSLLPYLEQTALYNSINFSADSDPSYDIKPSAANATVASTSLGVFLCPSDWLHGGNGTAGTNYRVNQGTAINHHDKELAPPIEGVNGAFEPLATISPADITDGLSQTAAFSEKPIGEAGAVLNRFVGFWTNGAALYTTSEDLLAACRATPGQSVKFDFQNDVGTIWFKPTLRYTAYNHTAGPNSGIPDCIGGWDSPTPHFHGTFAARSYHPGVVNVTFMDGHARAVRDQLRPAIWGALGTRNGGEIIGDSD